MLRCHASVIPKQGLFHIMTKTFGTYTLIFFNLGISQNFKNCVLSSKLFFLKISIQFCFSFSWYFWKFEISSIVMLLFAIFLSLFFFAWDLRLYLYSNRLLLLKYFMKICHFHDFMIGSRKFVSISRVLKVLIFLRFTDFHIFWSFEFSWILLFFQM